MSYGQLKDYLHGPHGAAALDSYATAHRLNTRPTAAEYQQAMFDQAKARLLDMAATNPNAYVFPDAADTARHAPNTARVIAHGDFVQPANGTMQNAPAPAQRYADVASDNAYAAPGMAVQPRSIAIAAPAPGRRVIRTVGPVVAGN